MFADHSLSHNLKSNPFNKDTSRKLTQNHILPIIIMQTATTVATRYTTRVFRHASNNDSSMIRRMDTISEVAQCVTVRSRNSLHQRQRYHNITTSTHFLSHQVRYLTRGGYVALQQQEQQHYEQLSQSTFLTIQQTMQKLETAKSVHQVLETKNNEPTTAQHEPKAEVVPVSLTMIDLYCRPLQPKDN